MSHHNPNKRSKTLSLSKGFTLVEMLVIAPIVILVIGVFISAIITMTGDVLANRAANALSYSVQDVLNRIEQDVKTSGGYLEKNHITLRTPQGYDDGTGIFYNVGTNGTMLILNTYATDSNPLSSSRNLVYINTPNACNSGIENQNPPLLMNIIYYVKSGTLWRRVVAKSDYATISCVNHVAGVPWQKPSCAPGYTDAFCKAQDMRLVDGIVTNGFSVNYYPTPDSTTANTIAGDSGQADSNRLTAMQSNSTIGVTINATQTIAGRDVSQTGTIRVVSPNNNITSN